MNGNDTRKALAQIAEKVAELTADFGFEPDEAYMIEDEFVGLEMAFGSLRDSMEASFEKAFNATVRKNVADFDEAAKART